MPTRRISRSSEGSSLVKGRGGGGGGGREQVRKWGREGEEEE